MSLLVLSSKYESVQLDVLDWGIKVTYQFKMPKGNKKTTIIEGTDIGGLGKSFIYEFNEGGILYISNYESLCPVKRDSLLVGNVLNRLSFPMDYNREFVGYIPNHGYYREWESLDIIIGYMNVPDCNKIVFDRAIESLIAKKVVISFFDGTVGPQVDEFVNTPHHYSFTNKSNSSTKKYYQCFKKAMLQLAEAVIYQLPDYDKADTIIVVSHFGEVHASPPSFYVYDTYNQEIFSFNYLYNGVPSKFPFETSTKYHTRLGKMLYPTTSNYCASYIINKYNNSGKDSLNNISQLQENKTSAIDYSYYSLYRFVRSKNKIVLKESTFLGYWDDTKE